MDIYDSINGRRSIRTYRTDAIPRETVMKVMEAAMMAPSWANKQCWRFLLVDNAIEKKIIGEASGQANIARACANAPYVVVLCANPRESGHKNGIEYYIFDCGLAMENLALAAHAEGLSTCIVGWFDEKAIKGLLNIPDDYKVVAFTPLGYGNENPPKRPRKKPDEIIFSNSWGRKF